MKDLRVSNEFSSKQGTGNNNTNASPSQMEEIEQSLKTQFEKNKGSDDTAWNSSVLRVLFKNESFARKYKVKIEKFLKELLDEGEEFIVYHPTHAHDEQEFEDKNQAFHIDRVNNESFEETKNLSKVPVYSSSYEDTLDRDNGDTTEKAEEEKKPSLMTCFNCLGDHHMKQCPEKIDWARINANKKEILVASTVRYHTDDQNNGFIPGIISDNLRKALGLKHNQLPQFIYHMRVIGYPPGWMKEALFEKSGLSLFDTDGRAVSDEQLSTSSKTGTLYDAAKFIEFPGFNTPVPEGIVDEWKSLKMPPLQPHQQLEEALKSPNIVNSSNIYKRKQNDDDVDSKKLRNAVQPCSPFPKGNVSENGNITPARHEKSLDIKTPDSKQNKRHSMSISMSPGTPVLEQGNPYQRLPGADKFAQGITEHLPFENLPDAVGTFEKMRGVISCVQKKLNVIKKS